MGLSGENRARKLEHIDVVLNKHVEGPGTTWFEYVFLLHHAASEVSLSDVDVRTHFLGRELRAPLLISAMTGGAPGTEEINLKLAEVAEKFGIGLGLGSQRAAVEDSRLEYTYRVVREYARSVPVIGNIGAYEFIKYDLRTIEKLVSMVEADALAVHLNLAQEIVQPEGTPNFSNLVRKAELIVRELSIPLVVKEVGQGLSYEVVKDLSNIGVRIFDVAGAGGTNWVVVEKHRAQRRGDKLKELIAGNLIDWGIPTAASIIEARRAAPHSTVIGSGGIRTSIDAVKALRIGADLVGIAAPVLRSYFGGCLDEYIGAFIHGIKAVIALTGSRSLEELRSRPVVITSMLREWLMSRGFDGRAE
ncbi:MAG: type 2 isopentenyl-diphosphate Delta-isomerase [Zestosphaera sp.]